MGGKSRWRSARRVPLAVLVALMLVAALVVLRDAATAPASVVPAAATPTDVSHVYVPTTGKVIGVLPVPAGWRQLRSAHLPFTMAYPPRWRVRGVVPGKAPHLTLLDARDARTITIAGRRLDPGASATSAAAALALTPVPQTLDPQIYLRSFPYRPARPLVTHVVAFQEAGYFWTVRMVERQDVHLPEGLHDLQVMLATFKPQPTGA
jgi:hypothetical protein